MLIAADDDTELELLTADDGTVALFERDMGAQRALRRQHCLALNVRRLLPRVQISGRPICCGGPTKAIRHALRVLGHWMVLPWWWWRAWAAWH